MPAQLHLQWSRDFGTPKPAFPQEVRLAFDVTYEPVVLGETMFVPSMVTDSVTALDVATGAKRWRFFADGPIRFAPVAANGKVYVGSDDGFLYCLSASDGTLLWKFQGETEAEKERKLLGHGRLISLRPVRGGPVLADGVLYFAAGIWPDDGVSVHALNAETGKPIWSNSDSNQIPKANMDHGIANVAGLTPQGYFALVGGHLVVPCGAQLAAFLDPQTGKLKDYAMGWGGRVGLPKGSWFAAGAGKHLSHSGDLYDVTRRNDEKFRDARGRTDFKNMLYAGGFTRLVIDPTNQRELGAFRQPVITKQALFTEQTGGNVVAYDLTDVKVSQRSESKPVAPRAKDQYPDKLKADLKELWRLKSALKVQIRAGNRIYLAGAGKVASLELPAEGGTPTIDWQAEITGTPHRLLAAAGRLFVVTLEGTIHAFGGAKPAQPIAHAKPAAPLKATAAQATVAENLKSTNTHNGYALVLGLNDGTTVTELLRQSGVYVLAVDDDAQRVATLREELYAAGLYGTRASVHVGNPLVYSLPPYMATLIVSEQPALLTKSAAEALFPQLRPYGGSIVASTEAGKSELVQRKGPLPLAADWSHDGANAANSGASQDYFLKAPLGLLWYDASLRWHRKPGSAVVRVVDGRTIVRADMLHAVDVYTGLRLWETKLPVPGKVTGDLVVVSDAIYLAAAGVCYVFDPVTGKPTGELKVPEGTKGSWSNLRVVDGSLVASVGKHIVCIDRKAGKPAWTFACDRPDLSLAVSDTIVYCAELLNKRRGEKPTDARLTTRALDLRTGKLVWETAGGSDLRYSKAHDLLVTAGGTYNGKDGKRVRAGNPAAQLIGDRLVLGTADRFSVYDLVSGNKQGDELNWNRRGCTGLRSSVHLVTTRFRGNAAYVDLDTREITPIFNIRSACNNNLYPANGILNVPNVTGGCECNYTPVSKAFAPLSVINP